MTQSNHANSSAVARSRDDRILPEAVSVIVVPEGLVDKVGLATAAVEIWVAIVGVQVKSVAAIAVAPANLAAATAPEQWTAVARVTSALVRQIAAAHFKVSIVAAVQRAARASAAVPAEEAVAPPGVEEVEQEVAGAVGSVEEERFVVAQED